MESIKSNNFLYFLLFLLLALSNFEFFFRENVIISGFYFIVIIAWILFVSKKVISNAFIIYCILILFVSILQCFVRSSVNFNYIIGLSLALIGSLAITNFLRDRFVSVVVGVIYFISLYSLIIYILCLDDGIYNFFYNNVADNNSLNVKEAVMQGGGRNFIIYNFQSNHIHQSIGIHRNCGPFWEPGMFACYILIALFFNIFIQKQRYRYCNTILIFTLISTFSTGGFIGGIVLIIFYIFKIRLKSIANLIIIPTCLIGIVCISNLEYIGDKTTKQYNTAEVGTDVSRFSAFLTQIKIIEKSPFIGGENISKYTTSKTLASGTLLPFVNYGLPMGIIYYFLLFIACRNIAGAYRKKIEGIELFILIMTISFSQTILTNAFFMLLLIYGLIYNPNNNKIIKHKLNYV